MTVSRKGAEPSQQTGRSCTLLTRGLASYSVQRRPEAGLQVHRALRSHEGACVYPASGGSACGATLKFPVPRDTSSKYAKPTIIAFKGKTDKSTVSAGNFNIPLLTVDRASIKNVSENTDNLNNTVNKLDLSDTRGTQNMAPNNTVVHAPFWHVSDIY